MRRCSLIDCEKPHEAKTYCKNHYRMYRKHGDPLKRGISSSRFTTERVKQLWRDGKYKNKKVVSYGKRKEGVCKICGTAFSYYPSNKVSGNHCSKVCSYQSQARSSKLREASTGKKASEETRRKLSEAHIGLRTGEQIWNWKGGISKIHQKLRQSSQYATWRKKVFERDDYTCQICLHRGGVLIADHYPYPFAKYPDKRLDISNGRTLCKPCNYHVTYVTKEWRVANG